MKLTTTPVAALLQLSLLLVLLGLIVGAILSLRSCARDDDLPFWSEQNRRHIVALYLTPKPRALIVEGYGPDWRFPFDAMIADDPVSLETLVTDRGLQDLSASIWDRLFHAGHLNEFNYHILRNRARINVGFAVIEGKQPVFLVDSDSWWHIFWSDGSTNTLVKP